MSAMLLEQLGEAAPSRIRAQELMDGIEADAANATVWLHYENLEHAAAGEPDLPAGLIEYAGDDTSTSSLLLRSFALEAGLRGIRHNTGAHARRPLTPAEVRIYGQAQELVPEYFQGTTTTSFITFFDGSEMTQGDTSYDWFFQELSRQEGVSQGLIHPAAHELGYDPSTVTNNIPVAAGLLLERMMSSEAHHDIAALPPSLARDALRTALDFRSGAYAASIAEPPSNTGEFARLARFTERGGYEHDAPLEFLYTLPGERGLAYTKTLNRLYDALAGLRDVFPGSIAEDVVLGARRLTANALFAVVEHLRAGEHTDETLQLLGGSEVQVTYTGSEPLAILQKLGDVVQRAHQLISDPHTEVSLEVDETNFAIYAFHGAATGDPLRAIQYFRPEGGFGCNYRYEYGGRRRGVQASIDLRLDEGEPRDPRRPYHKTSASSEGISIRLDREGREPNKAVAMHQQDPTQETGTVSLDIGSVMGDGFGTRVGRLLAWGNALRSQAANVPPSLNHTTDKIDQRLGGAGEFAGLAREAMMRLDARRADHPRVAPAAAALAVRTN